MGNLGRKIEQRTDGSAGLGSRSEFHNLPQQNERCNGSRYFEINIRLSAHPSKRSREKTGCQRGNCAVKVSSAGSYCNQAEHVEISGKKGPPASLQQRPSAPEDSRPCKGQLHPVPAPRTAIKPSG